uniref:DNA-directed RNA polymerase subunit beta n=1 Tax=Lepocinclis ovum TaxID=86638 RepID=A0A3G3LLY1_9EUGL|nr:RNA polymerase beta subunit [Lepocinclis ovum]AYQ93716.1 RNA polymerase beta subunit [Lepocinclis ovum]
MKIKRNSIKVTYYLKMQRNSYKYLLEKGLTKKVLSNIKIIKKYGFIMKFNSFDLRYKKPKFSSQQCIARGKTYSTNLFINVLIRYKNNIILKNRYIPIGDIPLITKKGTFIINGNVRIIVNQCVRSPGVFFYKNNKEQSLFGTLVPVKGSWLTIKINKKNETFFKIDRMRNNISAFYVLNALGLTQKKIFQCIKKKRYLIESIRSTSKNNSLNPIESKMRLNYKTNEKLNIIHITKLFISKFRNKDIYDLGKIGRNKLNKKLYLIDNFSKNNQLQPEDLLGITNYLVNIKNGLGNIDDIDNLKNKKIKLVGEIIENQILLTLKELIENIKEKFSKLKGKINKKNTRTNFVREIISTRIISSVVRSFFNSNQLCQIIEEINPLSEITHKRKVTSISNTKQKLNMQIREINETHYRKICPVETVEGKNAGLIWSLAKEARINKYGFIETSFYVNKLIQKNKINKIQKGIFYLSSEHEIANLTKIKDKKRIFYIPTSRLQIVSLGTSLIPFLEHNDANRALMGSNMQRQAVPLIKKEQPIISTGIENIVVHNNEYNILAYKTGLVKYSSSKKIVVHENIKTADKIDRILTLSKSFLVKIKKNKNVTHYSKFIKRTYKFKKSKSTNQNTYLYEKSLIKEGEWVKRGQLLTESASTDKSKLSLGKNILIAYLPWKGYNFEDAIVISEKLINKDVFTSIHIKKYKTFLVNNETGEEKLTNNIPNMKYNKSNYLNKNGIIKSGTFVKGNSILVGKIKKIKYANTKIKLLNIIFKRKYIKNTSLKLPSNNNGTIIGTKIMNNKTLCIIIYLLEKRNIQIGDKISGRHGNKGVVSKILKVNEMPYLQDGTPIDIILNPLGIPSRMNVGQVFECLLGLAGKYLKENYELLPFDEIYGPNTSNKIVYNKLYEASKKTKKNWILNPNFLGKTKLFDGRTSRAFKQPITVGYAYMLKLIHLVKDKVTVRSIGSYSYITKQPLKGKSKKGGQRFGEMELWALESYGSAYILQEVITLKSDDLTNKYKTINSLIKGNNLPKPNTPESIKVFILELQALCLDITIYSENLQKRLF